MTDTTLSSDQYNPTVATPGFAFGHDNDTLTILSNVLVGSALANGVETSFNNNVITNNGYIAGGGNFAGVAFGNSSAGELTNNIGATILGGNGVQIENAGKTVFNHGDIIGFYLNGFFIDENVGSFSLTNDGNVFGHLDGVFIDNVAIIDNIGLGVINGATNYGIEFDGNTATITNDAHATIIGAKYSIYTHEFGSLSLTNFGTLDGDILFTVPIANNTVFNKGTIHGNVTFQSGGATFTDAGLGHVTGAIVGGTGDDTFIAGRAKEVFSAGTGADKFVFNAVLFSPAGAKHDLIFNFSHYFVFGHNRPGGDRIDLHAIDADITHAGQQHFVFIGTDTFAHYHSLHPGVVGMLRFAAGVHQLQGTVDGDFSAPDFVVGLPGLAALHTSDLILA